MNKIKTKITFILLLFIMTNESLAQKKPEIEIDSVKLNGNNITLNSLDSFLKTQNVNELNFEEYVEKFQLSSGDKLNYYFDENIKYTVVFYGQKKSLQNITLFSDKPKLIIKGKLAQVGMSKSIFISKFPSAQFNNDSVPYEGVSSFNLNLGNGTFGNITFEFNNDEITKIYLRFIE